MRKRWWLPLAVLCAGALALWPLRDHLTAEAIAARSPRQAWLAALFLLGLYVLKGLSMAFPLTALEAAGGLLFPFPAALAINTAGVPWRAYLAGGVLGSFPRVLAATWLGAALWDIGSPRFFLSLLPGAGLTLLSLLLWRGLRRRSKKGHPEDVLSAESSIQ